MACPPNIPVFGCCDDAPGPVYQGISIQYMKWGFYQRNATVSSMRDRMFKTMDITYTHPNYAGSYRWHGTHKLGTTEIIATEVLDPTFAPRYNQGVPVSGAVSVTTTPNSAIEIFSDGFRKDIILTEEITDNPDIPLLLSLLDTKPFPAAKPDGQNAPYFENWNLINGVLNGGPIGGGPIVAYWSKSCAQDPRNQLFNFYWRNDPLVNRPDEAEPNYGNILVQKIRVFRRPRVPNVYTSFMDYCLLDLTNTPSIIAPDTIRDGALQPVGCVQAFSQTDDIPVDGLIINPPAFDNSKCGKGISVRWEDDANIDACCGTPTP